MAKNKAGILLKDRYKNVLVARFSALGDVAMTIPVIYSVCASHPGTRFIMLTQPVASTLFVNAPANLVVESTDVKHRYKGVKGLYHYYKYLKSTYHPDVFIDLHDVLRTWILGAFFFLLGGISVKRIDKGRAGKRALTRRRDKRMFPLISSRERYREVFYRAGFTFQETFKSIFASKHADDSIYAEISSPKESGERWIAVAPFAKHQGKIYPMQLMEKVVKEMSGWDNTRIFLFGAGKKEQKILGKWAEKYSDVTSLAGKRYGFPMELALLSHCDVMLSMDSANMHLASLVCLPVVSVWGATHPYCGFMGWHQDPRDTVQLNMVCRPCSVFGNKPCRYHDFFCLNGIAPSLIITHIQDVLQRQGSTH